MNLYKYSLINHNTKINLKNNQVYIQSVDMFNDPYEFIFRFSVKNEIFVDFLKLIYADKYIEFSEKKLSKEKILSHTRDYYFCEVCKSLGAFCLTENENDDIMWAHYGGNHKGICIEYDKSMHPFNLCEQVKYVNEVMNLKVDNLLNFEDNIPIIFSDVLIRKNTIWHYENEWRLLSEANSAVEYPPDAVRSITFGFCCDEESKVEIYEATAHLKIKYYDVVRAKDAYKIEKRLIEGQ